MSHKQKHAAKTQHTGQQVKKPTIRLIKESKAEAEEPGQDTTVWARSVGHSEPAKELAEEPTPPVLEPVYSATGLQEPPLAAPEPPRAALEAPRIEEEVIPPTPPVEAAVAPPAPLVHRRNRLINTPFGLGARVALRWMQATGAGGGSSNR